MGAGLRGAMVWVMHPSLLEVHWVYHHLLAFQAACHRGNGQRTWQSGRVCCCVCVGGWEGAYCV